MDTVSGHGRATRTRTFDIQQLLTGAYQCAECVSRVCRAASRLPGVREATCDDVAIHVVYDPALVSERDLVVGVDRTVAEATVGVEHAAFRVAGLD